MLWVGTDDGLVQLTRDDGGHWSNVTPKAMPAWGSVDSVEPSRFDAETAYVAVDRHKLDDIKPYAFKTADGGKSWTPISAGIPDGAVVHVVREDPVRRGLLYAGTEKGVFVSFDDGADQQSLQLDLLSTPIHDLALRGDDLIAATHGRAFWILDDVTPLRQVGIGSAQADVVFYKPQTALRLSYPDAVDSRHPVGEDPPFGVLIDYYLKTAPADELTVDIYDGSGALVRHLSSTHSDKPVQPPEWPDQIVPDDRIAAKAGMNRLVWDLRWSDPVQIPGAFYSGPDAARSAGRRPGPTTGEPQRRRPDLRAGARHWDRSAHAGAGPAIQAKFDLAMKTLHDIDTGCTRAVNEVRDTYAALEKAKIKASAGEAPTPSGGLIADADGLEAQLRPVEGADAGQ